MSFRVGLYVHVQTNFIYNCLHFFSIMYTTRHTYILSLRNNADIDIETYFINVLGRLELVIQRYT